MRRIMLVLLVMATIFGVGVAADAGKYDKRWQEDLLGDGVKETITTWENGSGSGGTFWCIKITRKGKTIFDGGYSNDDVVLFRDVTKKYQGKEIIICVGIFDKGTYKNMDYEVSWYGWDTTAERYVVYSDNWAKTRKLRAYKEAIAEFKSSGEEGKIYKAIQVGRRFIDYAKKRDWDACKKVVHNLSMEGESQRNRDDYIPPVDEMKKYGNVLKGIYFCPTLPGFSTKSDTGPRVRLVWQKPLDRNFYISQYQPDCYPSICVDVNTVTKKVFNTFIFYGNGWDGTGHLARDLP